VQIHANIVDEKSRNQIPLGCCRAVTERDPIALIDISKVQGAVVFPCSYNASKALDPWHLSPKKVGAAQGEEIDDVLDVYDLSSGRGAA
jgi:hypothetical protein